MLTRILVLSLALGASMLSAADVTGKWKGAMSGRDGNNREVSFQFKQDGEKLTGSLQGPMGNDVDISNGSVKGDVVKFQVKLAFGDRDFTMSYDGKVASGEILMKIQREGAPRATTQRASSRRTVGGSPRA